MPPILDRVDSSLSELSQQPWGYDYPIYNHMKTFEDGLGFLTLFLDCIQMWSDAVELVPHLVTVATRIEASIQKIGGKFLENMKRDKRVSIFTTVSFNLGGTFEKRASKWLYIFTNLSAMIDLLKPQIAEACDVLSIHSAQSQSPIRDFLKWKQFVKSTYLHLCDVQGNFDARDRRPKLHETEYVQSPLIEVFLDNLAHGSLTNPEIEDFMIKVGSATIHGALLCCHWWARNFDANIRNDVISVLSDLQQKISFTNPEFAEMIVRLPKASDDSTIIAREFSNHLTPITSIVREPIPLYTHLRVELRRFLDLDRQLISLLLSDSKQLLMEIASLHHSVQVNDTSVIQYLYVKILLMVMEIFVRAQLVADKILAAKRIIPNFSYKARKIQKSSRRSTKSVKKILRQMAEVAKDQALLEESAYRENINKKTVRNMLFKSLLKTLFCKANLIFTKLHDNSDTLVVSHKDRIEAIHKGFKTMIACVVNQPGGNFKNEKLEFSYIEAIASRVISLYHLILTQNITEEMIRPLLSDLLDEINLIMKELKNIYLHVPSSNFPKTNSVGFIDSLLSKLRELLQYKAYLTKSVITKQQLKEILSHLEIFQFFLQHISEQDTMFQELKELGARGRIFH